MAVERCLKNSTASRGYFSRISSKLVLVYLGGLCGFNALRIRRVTFSIKHTREPKYFSWSADRVIDFALSFPPLVLPYRP